MEAMRAFCAPEVLDGNNQFYCEQCQAKQDAHKVAIAHIPLGLSRHILTRLTYRACQAVLFYKLDTDKMHGLNTSNMSCLVALRLDVTSQVEFLGLSLPKCSRKRLKDKTSEQEAAHY